MSTKKVKREGRSSSSSLRRLKVTVSAKRTIIELRESGMSVANIARQFGRTSSTICTILKNKDKIMQVDASRGLTRISAQRIRVLDSVERRLLAWINEKRLRGEPVGDEQTVRERARLIFADVVATMPGGSKESAERQFKGSRGWFERLKLRIAGLDSLRSSVGSSTVDCRQQGCCSSRVGPQDSDEREEADEGTVTVKQEITAEATKQQSLGAVRDMVRAWDSVASYIESHHPYRTVAVHATALFNEHAVAPFRQMLKNHKAGGGGGVKSADRRRNKWQQP